MEHIVDTVLYFEGDKMLPYRILRAAKNRYGSTNEIGMFDMTGKGLKVVENPSKLLLEGRPVGVSGQLCSLYAGGLTSHFIRDTGTCEQNCFRHAAPRSFRVRF